MIRTITLMLMLVGSSSALGQLADPNRSRPNEVRAALENVRRSGKLSISGVLFDMRTFEGKLVRVEADTFTVDSRRKSLPRPLMTIKYEQVLELNAKGVSISYFPDPDLSPFGDWDEVKKLTRGDILEVDKADGTDIVAVLLRVNDLGIELVDGNRTREITKDKIQRIYLARLEPNKAVRGAGKGARAAGRGPGRNASIGAAAVHGAVLIGAVTAGAIHGAMERTPNDRLLIYAK